MSDEMKPREFYMAAKTNNWLSGDREDEYCETIHVIEKSAYDELARKLEIARFAIERAWVEFEVNRLRQCADMMKDALRDIEK